MEVREAVLIPHVPNNSYGLCGRKATLNTIACVPTYSSSCTDPGCLPVVWENRTGTCFAYVSTVLGQPAGLSQEACLYVRGR